jgi:hypothetical protein
VNYTVGQKSVLANVFDLALFAQDDWKFNDRLTLSGGLRWETQNHIADHNDWAPRIAIAYALDGGKDKKAKTVLRGGYGFFYDRFDGRNLLTINRTSFQNETELNNPTSCTGSNNANVKKLDNIDITTCGTSTPVKYEVAPHFHSPYNEQASISVERQLSAGASMTLNYMHSFGVHQQVTRNVNQADSGGDCPIDSTCGYQYEYYPEAVFKQNQLIASVNSVLNKKMSVTSFYTLSFANTNGNGNASDGYNLDKDYGRAGFVARNMLFMMGNYSGPLGLRFSPFLIAQSGRPFNITLSSDPLNNFFNQRPGIASFADCQSGNSRYVSYSSVCLDSTPASGDARVPVNIGNGPAAVAFNLRISRGFGIGPKLASATTGQDNGGGMPPGGPPPGGGRGGPGGGGGRGGGFGMGGPGGMSGASTGHKYSLTFSAQALNLFNDIDKGQPNGTVTAPNFGKSNSMAYGIFSQGSAARRIYVQAVFSF